MTDLNLAPSPPSPPTQSLAVPIGIIVAIGALYVGRDVFVPLVLAILVTFALVPVVRRLEKIGLPHVVAVPAAVLTAAVMIGGITYLIVTQLIALAADLPQYQQIVSSKLRALQQTTSNSGVLNGIADLVQNLGSAAEPTGALEAGAKQPVPVTMVSPGRGPLDYVGGALESLLGPLATTAIVVVFVIFLLLEREGFRDRFLKLVSRGDLRTSTKVLNESGKRVSRYLLVQFFVNLLNGVVFGLGVWAIGIPNAILWGILAALFRYIPFVGTLIGAAIPFALAFAIDPGWSMLIETLVLYSVLELVITNGIEPRLYGSSTGLSALAVLVAAIFWSTLWGPIGLILATPITVCLVVVGRYVPQLKFLEILLGDQPVLAADEQLYQRLLAGNTEEAVDLAEAQLAERSAQSFYDEVAVPALRLAEADRVRNLTDVTARRAVVDGMAEVVAEVEHLNDEKLSAGAGELQRLDGLSVICIGGRTEIDAAAADMVAQVVARPGVTVTTFPPLVVRQEGIGRLELAGADIVCLVYVGEQPRSFARFVARRIKRRDKRIAVLICLLSTSESGVSREDFSADCDFVATSIAAAEATMIQWHASSKLPQPTPDSATAEIETVATERDRLRAAIHDQWLETLKAEAANTLGVQIAIVAVVNATETAPLPPSSTGTEPTSLATASIGPLSHAIVVADDMLVINDTAADEVHAQDQFLLENGTRFFAGVPVRSREGTAIGVLCILDDKPREFSERERRSLGEFATRIAERVNRAESRKD